jgi:nitroreductase
MGAAGDPVDVLTALRTTGTCRSFTSEKVPDELIAEALDAARFAPQGGNLQPVRWIVVRDRRTIGVLAGWYLELWDAYLAEVSGGERGVGTARSSLAAADRFARAMADVPALVVVGAKLSALYATDQGQGRLSVVGGASVYPAVQSFCLACRALGLGTALTTLLCQREPDVKALLEMPRGVATVAHIAVGRPARPWPEKLTRRPLSEVAFGDAYGRPLPGVELKTSTGDRPLD